MQLHNNLKHHVLGVSVFMHVFVCKSVVVFINVHIESICKCKTEAIDIDLSSHSCQKITNKSISNTVVDYNLSPEIFR